jgi:hypothetical protein
LRDVDRLPFVLEPRQDFDEAPEESIAANQQKKRAQVPKERGATSKSISARSPVPTIICLANPQKKFSYPRGKNRGFPRLSELAAG